LIESFGDKATEALFHGTENKLTRQIPNDIVKTALRKLDLLNAAEQLDDLRSRPGNHLEALKGDLKGFYSIRINDQWRIIFRWELGLVKDVEIIDYHN